MIWESVGFNFGPGVLATALAESWGVPVELDISGVIGPYVKIRDGQVKGKKVRVLWERRT